MEVVQLANGIYNAVNTLFESVGLTTADGMILFVVCLAIIFGYQDHKIGLISLLLMSVSLIVFFALTGMDTLKPIALMFIAIIGLAFSLYYSRQKGGIF